MTDFVEYEDEVSKLVTTSNHVRMDRKACLDAAAKCVCEDRNEQYGEPKNNFKIIADYWNLYLDIDPEMPITAQDVAIMMTLFKIARMQTGKPKDDNFIDAIGYLACGCEIAEER